MEMLLCNYLGVVVKVWLFKIQSKGLGNPAGGSTNLSDYGASINMFTTVQWTYKYMVDANASITRAVPTGIFAEGTNVPSVVLPTGIIAVEANV